VDVAPLHRSGPRGVATGVIRRADGSVAATLAQEGLFASGPTPAPTAPTS